MSSDLTIRLLEQAEVNSAFELLQATGQWLASMGKRQRIANTPLSSLQTWQSLGQLYGVFVDSEPAGIFALTVEQFQDWLDFQHLGEATWLRALATHPQYRGMDIGSTAIRYSLKILGTDSPLYLDCVAGFLPQYYARHGFEKLATQDREYTNDGRYRIVLMKHSNTI